jgi:hypothetical protein
MLQHGTNSGRYASRKPNCLSLDTEILTDKGWLTYAEWEHGAKVAAVKDGKVNWEIPENIYLSDESPKTMISLKNQHIDIRATDDHRISIQSRKTEEIKEVTFNEIMEKTYGEYRILHGGIGEFEGINLTDDDIRFLVALQADGYFQSKNIARFTFTKTRKRDRIRTLLQSMGITYTEPNNKRFDFYVYGMDTYLRRFEGLLTNKIFDWGLLQMNPHQREVFLSELDHWDGLYTRPRKQYGSCIEKNTDVVQALVSLSGMRGHKRIYDYNQRLNGHSLSYQLDMTNRVSSLLTNIERYSEVSNEMVWCVKVPSDQFIARRGSDTFVVHNCQQLPSHSALGMVIKRGFIA